jgi:hypothetical protein
VSARTFQVSFDPSHLVDVQDDNVRISQTLIRVPLAAHPVQFFSCGFDTHPLVEGSPQGWLWSARGHQVHGLEGDPRSPGSLLDAA